MIAAIREKFPGKEAEANASAANEAYDHEHDAQHDEQERGGDGRGGEPLEAGHGSSEDGAEADSSPTATLGSCVLGSFRSPSSSGLWPGW